MLNCRTPTKMQRCWQAGTSLTLDVSLCHNWKHRLSTCTEEVHKIWLAKEQATHKNHLQTRGEVGVNDSVLGRCKDKPYPAYVTELQKDSRRPWGRTHPYAAAYRHRRHLVWIWWEALLWKSRDAFLWQWRERGHCEQLGRLQTETAWRGWFLTQAICPPWSGQSMWFRAVAWLVTSWPKRHPGTMPESFSR